MVEWDEGLIGSGESLLSAASVGWRYHRLDLARDLGQLAESRVELITASALIDLVSAEWLDHLIKLRRRTGAALYIVLSFDGRITWEPADPLDQPVRELVDTHQRTDKGFGPALGPSAVESLRALLASDDGAPNSATSDWILGPADQTIQLELLVGYEAASVAMAPKQADALTAWAQRRREWIVADASHLRAGHRDLLLLSG